MRDQSVRGGATVPRMRCVLRSWIGNRESRCRSGGLEARRGHHSPHRVTRICEGPAECDVRRLRLCAGVLPMSAMSSRGCVKVARPPDDSARPGVQLLLAYRRCRFDFRCRLVNVQILSQRWILRCFRIRCFRRKAKIHPRFRHAHPPQIHQRQSRQKT